MNHKLIKTYRVKVDNCRLVAYQRQKELLFLYGPIVGSQALNLYNNLLVQGLCHQAAATTPQQDLDLSFLVTISNCNQTQFHHARCQLEAMNLLITVVTAGVYVFYPRPPLEAELFLENVKYMRLLQHKQPQLQLKQLSTNFNCAVTTAAGGRHNISTRFDQAFQSGTAAPAPARALDFKVLDERLIALNFDPRSYWPFRRRIATVMTFFHLRPQLALGFVCRSYHPRDKKFNFVQFEQQVNHYVLREQPPLHYRSRQLLPRG